MKAFNFVTNTEYSGQNAALVGNGKYPAFASFNQLKSMGYSVNKGAKSVSVFCGYRENKDGDKVPCWGRVFDIIDTTAKDDKDLLDFIENGKRFVNDTQVNHELVGALSNGAKGVEQVKQAYSKEISATEMMRSMGIEVVQMA